MSVALTHHHDDERFESGPAPPPRASAGGANHGSAGPSFLAERFPAMFQGVEKCGQWFPLPASLVRFLREKFGARNVNALVLTLDLFQGLDRKSQDPTVQVTDRTAARRTGIDLRNLQRTRRSPEFQRLVEVEVGKQCKKDFEGEACTYNLGPLMVDFNVWLKKENDL